MGAAASQAADAVAPIVPETGEHCVASGVSLFPAYSLDASLQQRGAEVLIEIGREGFRIVRAKTLEPLAAFPFAEVHSWSHGPTRFSFKYYDDRVRTVVDYSFRLNCVGELLAAINRVINEIMSEREGHMVSGSEFAALHEALAGQAPDARLAFIIATAKDKFFTAAQGRQLMASLDSNFDKMDVACALHQRLVDQTQFSVLLGQLESTADVDNVWHRISASKKPQFQALRKSMSKVVDAASA
ncbi:hypothetical protein WJX72_003994 [[Myrmecia] bisecta]|uniref:DUF4476 domain-containing protein n=1 Tax=[Myrmecia] bisecta TaxID=41462 RepID=A0AAW1PWL5_9CHLO